MPDDQRPLRHQPPPSFHLRPGARFKVRCNTTVSILCIVPCWGDLAVTTSRLKYLAPAPDVEPITPQPPDPYPLTQCNRGTPTLHQPIEKEDPPVDQFYPLDPTNPQTTPVPPDPPDPTDPTDPQTPPAPPDPLRPPRPSPQSWNVLGSSGEGLGEKRGEVTRILTSPDCSPSPAPPGFLRDRIFVGWVFCLAQPGLPVKEIAMPDDQRPLRHQPPPSFHLRPGARFKVRCNTTVSILCIVPCWGDLAVTTSRLKYLAPAPDVEPITPQPPDPYPLTQCNRGTPTLHQPIEKEDPPVDQFYPFFTTTGTLHLYQLLWKYSCFLKLLHIRHFLFGIF